MVRIVKLSFSAEYIQTFERNFPAVKKLVEGMSGCKSVELLKSTDGIYFTISNWESEAHLEAYRNSETFKQIWSEFKAHFSEKAAAWTTHKIG